MRIVINAYNEVDDLPFDTKECNLTDRNAQAWLMKHLLWALDKEKALIEIYEKEVDLDNPPI